VPGSTLGIIGCGKMAYALMQGIKREQGGSFAVIYCNDIDPQRLDLFNQEFGALAVSGRELVDKSDLVVLAVKPQQVWQVLEKLEGSWRDGTLLVSIAAGIKTADLERALKTRLPVVRVMPNTPCLIGSGICAVAAGSQAKPQELERVRDLLASMGKALILEEKYMDAVTAVSGSGPAYAYLVLEAFINAAINVGLDAALAKKLVVDTFRGSIDMVEQSEEHPAQLREQVCSPAGTTIAGVRQLEAGGLRRAFFDAVEQAYLRSIELGQVK
jgi:pyrroline-5-carboxylate reductase